MTARVRVVPLWAVALVSLSGCGNPAAPPASQPGAWTPTAGPPGATVWSFAASGTSLFAGTETGRIFRSTDHGATWVGAGSGRSNMAFLAMALSGAHLFAGTFEPGVLRSTDDGASWTLLNNGLPAERVSALVSAGTGL